MRNIISTVEHWPVAGTFRISRSAITTVDVVTVAIHGRDGRIGYGECRPYARYGETPDSVRTQISTLKPALESLDHALLQTLLPAGAARNAVDCALWDLKAQQSGLSVAQMLNLPPAKPRVTAFTLSIDTPAKMQSAARKALRHSILKIKIGDYAGGLTAAKAIMEARPDAQLIIDANEALSVDEMKSLRSALSAYPVLLIEQPCPDQSSASSRLQPFDIDPDQIPILCADESLHTSEDLQRLWAQGYRSVNVKLDKTGGLTEAVQCIRQAKSMGFVIMLGCMVGTSLALAPATLLMPFADVIDLDGALLLAKDRDHGLTYEGDRVHPAALALWGHPRGSMRLV